MIAARQIAFGRSAAAKWINPYITDGLIAMWDGEWNAGGGKHDANATVWKELSGFFKGVDFPIGEHIIEADCVRCDTKNQMRVARPSSFFDLVKDGYTAEIVTTLPDAPPVSRDDSRLFGAGYSQTPLLFPRKDLISAQWTNLYGGVGNDKSWATSLITAAMCGLESFSNVKFSYSLQSDIVSQQTNIFFNATKVSSIASAGMIGDNMSLLVGFGINGNGRGNYTESIGEGTRYHCVRWYSRALTADEIAHNYNIDKARFGL